MNTEMNVEGCNQDIFPLKNLPVNLFSMVLGELGQEDKNNFRLTCRWTNERVIQVDLSVRKWNMILTAENYKKNLEWLEAGLAKLEAFQRNPKILIGLDLIALGQQMNDNDVLSTVKKILMISCKYVTKLGLALTGYEKFLLQDEFNMPILQTLNVGIAFLEEDNKNAFSCLLEDLLVVRGMTLKTLELWWDCYIDPNSKKYPIQGLETLKLSCFSPANFCHMISIFGAYISILELNRMDDVDHVYLGECYIPKLKHLRIDSECKEYFQIARRNAKTIESFVYCQEGDEDYYPHDLPQFGSLKLLEVNCPVLNFAIIENCETLEYLYVPDQGVIDHDEIDADIDIPRCLPSLKDLCVQGTKRWSLEMIQVNCNYLEYLIIFEYMDEETFNGIMDAGDMEENDEYLWHEFVDSNCTFPNLKMLLLPGCTDSTIVEGLAAKCPQEIQVITDKKLVGLAVKDRINQFYSYTRYTKVMHRKLFDLFQFDYE